MTHPPSGPSTPPPPSGPGKDGLTAALLTGIDSSLVALLGVAVSLPDSEDRMEICGQEVLKHRLRMARKAVADLRAYQSPARQSLGSAAAVAGGPVKTARPRADRAGGPPAPGAGTFALPRPPEFAIGAAGL